MQKTEQFAFTVVIPAHNEQDCIGKCLRAIQNAADAVRPCRTEIIVIANRCTDKTAEIAASYGAVVLQNDDKCISSIRNTGIRAAKGRIVVTSGRKFDQFGDWYLIRNRKLTKQIFSGRDRKAADSFYYHVR